MANEKKKHDTAILLHRKWRGRLQWTRQIEWGMAMAVHLDHGKRMVLATAHLPNSWGYSQEQYIEACNDMQDILYDITDCRLAVGVDANLELPSGLGNLPGLGTVRPPSSAQWSSDVRHEAFLGLLLHVRQHLHGWWTSILDTQAPVA